MTPETRDARPVSEVELLQPSGIIGFDGNAPKGLRAHPDCEHIVYPRGHNVIIENLKTGAQRFLEGNSNVITAVAVSKSGKYVATGQVNYMGFRAPVIVWEFSSGEVVMKHETHKVRVEHVLFTSCETYIMSLGGRDDSNIVVFNIATKEAICGTFSSNRNAGEAVTLGALHKRGICFITGGVSTLKLWTLNQEEKNVKGVDVVMGKIKRKITCIEIEKTDNYAYCGTTTGDIMKVKLFFSKDLNDCTPSAPPALISCFGKISTKRRRAGHPIAPDLWSLGVRQIEILEDSMLLVGSGDGSLDLVLETGPVVQQQPKGYRLANPTIPTFKVMNTTNVGGIITSIQSLGEKIMVATILCEIYIVNIKTFETKLLVTCHTHAIYSLAFPAGHSDVFATASKNDVRIWSTKKYKELLRITVPNYTCSCLMFSFDGRFIVTSWNDGKIRAFTPISGQLIFTIYNAHENGVLAVAITRDGKKILSGGGDGQVRAWMVKKQKQSLLAVLKEHRRAVSSISIARSDRQAATASTDGTCIIWDLQKYTRVAILFSSTLFMCVQYHPNDCQLLTCGTNRIIGFWEVFDGTLVRELEGSTSTALNSLDFSEDGQHFVTGGNDQYVKVWKYKEGVTTHIGVGHAGIVTAVKISDDMKTIVSCSAVGSIFVWNSPFGPSQEAGRSGKAAAGKEENVGRISQRQNVHATTPHTAAGRETSAASSKDSKEEAAHSAGGGGDRVPPAAGEAGSIKCYCKGPCDCKPSDLPKSPPPTDSELQKSSSYEE